MIRRCPQCHTASDDRYGFCIKCGYEFPKLEVNPNICQLCNYENPDEADFCVKCGSPLIFKSQMRAGESSPNQIVIRKMAPEHKQEIENPPHTSRIIIILGYIFSILGGLLGLIIAIYLTTRKDPVAKKHGRIQLVIFIFYLILILVLILTGAITSDTLMQYSQMRFGNLTNMNL